MQTEKNIRNLLIKFAENKCSEEEYREVLRYFQRRSSSRNMPSVEEILEMSGDRSSMDYESAERIFQDIINHNYLPKNKKSGAVFHMNNLWRYVAAAAILLLVIGGYFFQKKWLFPISEPTFVNSEMEGSTWKHGDSITLELGNGQVEAINPNGNLTVRDADGNVLGQQNKARLVYEGGLPIEDLQYNMLRVPYGRRFEIQLSDGTTVHLNAGSTLKFPVRFPEKSETREVFVTGEAYFEVASNKDQPFIVNTGELDIRVLGTKFNVSTYPEDEHTDVVLVEGLVRLDTESDISEESEGQLLKPGYKASYDKSGKTITTQAVSTSVYTSWIDGELVFRNMTFEDILKKLERKYDVSIKSTNEKLAKVRFNASFGDESIDTVLNYLKSIYGINFTIEGNQVIIK